MINLEGNNLYPKWNTEGHVCFGRQIITKTSVAGPSYIIFLMVPVNAPVGRQESDKSTLAREVPIALPFLDIVSLFPGVGR